MDGDPSCMQQSGCRSVAPTSAAHPERTDDSDGGQIDNHARQSAATGETMRQAEQKEADRRNPVGPSFDHQWQPIGSMPGTWRCIACLTVANTGMQDAPNMAGCPGWPAVLARIGSGHDIFVYSVRPKVQGHSRAYACRLCYRTSTGRPVFAAECDQDPTEIRSLAFRRLERGQHPHCRWGKGPVYQRGYPIQPAVQLGAALEMDTSK